MNNDEREMARRCFGYGCWTAPSWFIGQEHGMAREENNDLRRRIDCWRSFGGRELDDACAFHQGRHAIEKRCEFDYGVPQSRVEKAKLDRITESRRIGV